MKKIITLMLIALGLSPVMMAQSYDDLYYNPNKKDTSLKKEEKKPFTEKKRTYVSTDMPVVVKDRKGNVRDIDEYNRQYNAKENKFEVVDDTLYVEEKDYPERGEWVNGFQGTQDDYEYAQRIVRFRNPRYAVSISSPYYWDIVYGLNSWDWNVYVDDFYAYAFPTYTNRLWWDWRYNSFGFGWGSSWGYPYWGGYYGNYYSGYWGGYYGNYGGGYGYWGHPYHGWDGSWYGGGYGGYGLSHTGYYNTRRSDFGDSRMRAGSSNYRTSSYSRAGGLQDRTSTYSRRSGSGRVVGTRSGSGYETGVSRRSGYIRSESSYNDRTDGTSRRTIYARPSSTRTYSGGSEGIERRSSSYDRSSTTTRSSSYSRGSSNDVRSYNSGNSSSGRSYDNSSSTRSYSPSNNSGGSYRSSGGSSGGGSSRSSGGGSSSGGSSRSSGGGSSSGGRR
jgi:hypothetical protein